MRWYGVLAVLVLLAGGTVPAASQPVRPLDQILPQIRDAYPGTFYDAEGPFRGPDGAMHYRLKWLTPSGRIVWLDADARTGRILGVDSGQRRPVWDRDDGGSGGRRYAPRNNFRDRDVDGDEGRGYERHDRGDRGDRGGWDRYDRRGNGNQWR